MDDETIHELIGTIYEAPVEPRHWELVVRRLRVATGSCEGHLYRHTIQDNVGTYTSTSLNLHRAFDHERLSISDFHRIGNRVHDPSIADPHLQRFHPSMAGEAFFDCELVSIDEYKRSAFYNEFARPLDCLHGLIVVMMHEEGPLYHLAFHRSESDPSYEDEDKRLLNLFVPHIRRSLNLHNMLQAARAQGTVLRNSIDTLSSAIVLLDQFGTVIFLNAAAEHLLKRCSELFVRRDRLCAKHHADSQKLHRLIRQVTGCLEGRPKGGAVTIQRAPCEHPMQVMAAPVPLDVRTSVRTGVGAVAMLMIRDPSEKTRVPEEIVAAMFGLTSAETRLLLALSNGQTLKQYADEAGLTQNTVRAYLKTVFAKTKTSRQSDLVRLMSGVTHSVAISDR